MFCSQCGAQAGSSVNFCTQCGARISQQSAPVYQEPAQIYMQPAQENFSQPTVLWTLSASEKVSMFKADQCYIVFFPDRLVLDYLTKERLKIENEHLTQEIRQSDMGFFKKSAAMMSYWSGYAKRYATMQPDQILALSPENKVLWNSAISQFFFHCYSEDFDEDSNTRSSGGECIILFTNGAKMKFSHKERHHKEYKEFLTGYFGAKLKYRK